MTRSTRSGKNAAIANIDKRVEQIGSELQKQLSELRKSVEKSSDEGEPHVPLEAKLSIFEENMHRVLNDLRKDIADIKNSLTLQYSYLKKQSYRNCIVLHGLPDREGLNLYSEVCNFLTSKLRADITIKDLSLCYRLGKKKEGNRPRPVYVQFLQAWKRDCIFADKKKLKGSVYFMTEMLLGAKLHLLNQVKLKFGNKNCWTRQGNVYVLIDNKVKHVKEVNDIPDAL